MTTNKVTFFGVFWLAATLAVAVLLPYGPATAGETRDRADTAFRDGDYPRALQLYQQSLAIWPDDLHSMYRSALLLSWENRLDEALALYDHLLTQEPDHRDAAFERAKVLSWDGRTEESAAAFEQILERRPDDVEVRLAYARSLSWMGAYTRSRAEYGRVIAEHPDRVEPIVGTAQTFAWGGQLKTARGWYEKALEVDPQDKNAVIGLASVELWSGNPGEANVLATRLAERFPEDKDVLELHGRTRKALAPWVRTFSERTDDTDENRLSVHGVSAGWGIRAGPSISVGVARFAMQDPTREATIDSLFSTIGFVPAQGQRLIVRAGVDRRENSTDETDSYFVGAAHYTWGLDRPWQFGAIAARDAIRYSPAIADNAILHDEYSAYVTGRLGSWQIHGNTGFAEVSDGNSRVHLSGGFRYRLRSASPRIEAGYRLRYMDYDQNLDNAYFDPSDFRAHIGQLAVNDTFGSNRNSYNVSLDAGIQSFTLNGNAIDNDGILVVAGALGLPLSKAFVLDVKVSWGDYAAQTANGFESYTIRIGLRWSDNR
jgi:tetratricopeptide (TPR) repeat protein